MFIILKGDETTFQSSNVFPAAFSMPILQFPGLKIFYIINIPNWLTHKRSPDIENLLNSC